MIFKLFYGLIFVGHSAANLLLGSYLKLYTGASDLDLSFIFMIQPIIIFTEPFISSFIDRHQSHKKVLTIFLLVNSLAYIPYVVIPFVVANKDNPIAISLTERRRYWLCATCQTLASASWVGLKCLGDSLAVNYARAIGSDYSNFKKFGPLASGFGGLLLGYINQDWILPDFVPALVFNMLSMISITLLVYLWPDECFDMRISPTKSTSIGAMQENDRRLPSNKEALRRAGAKFLDKIALRKRNEAVSTKTGEPSVKLEDLSEKLKSKPKLLSFAQQMKILGVLLRNDIRIGGYFLLLVHTGLVVDGPPNFVFTYMNQFCHETGTCNAALMAGFVHLVSSLVETLAYMVISAFRNNLNYMILIEVVFAAVMIHFYTFAFQLAKVSPYFLLFELAYGIENSFAFSSCIELAYRFANQVEPLIPELKRRKIISEEDDLELVKASLKSTLTACYVSAFDGIGVLVSTFCFGIITENYSFPTTFFFIGSCGLIGFFFVTLMLLATTLFRSRQPRNS